MRRWIPLLCLFSCTTEGDSGTSVGNPGKVSMSLGASEGYQLNRAHVEVEQLILQGCGAGEIEILVEDTMNLLDPTSIALPVGTWCSMQLVTSGLLVLEGSFEFDEEGVADFGVSLDLGDDLWLQSTGFSVDDNGFVLELGAPGWLAEAEFEPEDREVIEAEDSVALWLLDVLVITSGLYEDPNEDGQIDNEEREQEPVAISWDEDESEDNDDDDDDDDDDNEDDDDDDDTADGTRSTGDSDAGSVRGCTTSMSARRTPTLALLALLLGTARRRRVPDKLR